MYGKNAKTGKFVIGGRASFPVLVEPKPVGKRPKPGDTDKYQLTVVIPEDMQEEPWFAELKKAVSAAANAKFGEPGSDSRPRKIKSPFLTIDDLQNKVPEGYQDSDVFVRLHSTVRPQVVVKENGKVTAVPDAEIGKVIYPGCRVAVSVDIYAWKHEEGGAGVSLGLGNVMKTGDDDPWGATGTNAADDFGVDVEGNDAEDDFLG